jgi:hypothetical protein
MEQTPCRVFSYGKDMLHVLFQLRPPPLIPKNAADFGKTRQNGGGFASRTPWETNVAHGKRIGRLILSNERDVS